MIHVPAPIAAVDAWVAARAAAATSRHRERDILVKATSDRHGLKQAQLPERDSKVF